MSNSDLKISESDSEDDINLTTDFNQPANRIGPGREEPKSLEVLQENKLNSSLKPMTVSSTNIVEDDDSDPELMTAEGRRRERRRRVRGRGANLEL